MGPVEGSNHPVWGIDPSTRRVALAAITEDGFDTYSLELGSSTVDARKLHTARSAMIPWLTSIARKQSPGWVFCEQPFARVQSQVPIPSYLMLGIVMEAVYAVTGCPVNLIPPASWKAKAGMGGFATKGQILSWAREQGFTGSCPRCPPDGKCKGSPAHDLADALGVARAGWALVNEQLVTA
jgi:Holliday junction resolvasome RuvABC endonuclease subunit